MCLHTTVTVLVRFIPHEAILHGRRSGVLPKADLPPPHHHHQPPGGVCTVQQGGAAGHPGRYLTQPTAATTAEGAGMKVVFAPDRLLSSKKGKKRTEITSP
jgi:hypothetical protein